MRRSHTLMVRVNFSSRSEPLSLRSSGGEDALRSVGRIRPMALKERPCGQPPVLDVGDDEHTAAALGHPEVLGVEHPPRRPIGWA